MIDSSVVYDIIRLLPPDAIKTTFVLNSRQPRETGFTAVPWGYARRFSNSGTDESEVMIAAAMNGEQWHWFELFKTTETTNPKIGDTITDDSEDTWQIKKIDKRMFETIFQCLCLKNKS